MKCATRQAPHLVLVATPCTFYQLRSVTIVDRILKAVLNVLLPQFAHYAKSATLSTLAVSVKFAKPVLRDVPSALLLFLAMSVRLPTISIMGPILVRLVSRV